MPSIAALGLPDVRGRTPLLAGLLIDSYGGGCVGPLLLIYVNRVAGVPFGRAGLIVTLASVVSLAVPAVVGHVIDRYGARNLVVFAQLAQAVAFALFLTGTAEALLFTGALIMVVGQRTFWSSIFSLLADVSADGDRDRWYGLAGMSQATGFGLGSLTAGGLLAIGGNGPLVAAMIVNLASFLVAARLLGRLHVEHAAVHSSDSQERVRLRDDPRFIALTTVNGVLALCTMMIGIGLPVYVVAALPAPGWIVGALLAMVSVALATGQTLVVRITEGRRRTRPLILAAVVWTAWALLMAWLVHLPAGAVVPLLILGTVVFAVADVTHAATSNALAAAVAPVRGRGKYLSYFQYSFTVAQIAGPAFFTVLFEVRADLPWLTLAALAAAAGAALVVLDRELQPS